VLIVTTSCAQNNQQGIIAKEAVHKETTKKERVFSEMKPYDVTVKIESTALNENNLIFSVDIYDKSFLGSPHSNGYFVDGFTISLDETSNLALKDSIVEYPTCLESQDPWGDGRVYLVKRNTTFTQKLTIAYQNDFKVGGMFNFSIDPKLSTEEIKFIISQRSGFLSVEKLNTAFPFIK